MAAEVFATDPAEVVAGVDDEGQEAGASISSTLAVAASSLYLTEIKIC